MTITDEEINEIFETINYRLAVMLDMLVYIPVKQELTKYNVIHSLGQRKESFKSEMERELYKLRDVIKNNLDIG